MPCQLHMDMDMEPSDGIGNAPRTARTCVLNIWRWLCAPSLHAWSAHQPASLLPSLSACLLVGDGKCTLGWMCVHACMAVNGRSRGWRVRVLTRYGPGSGPNEDALRAAWQPNKRR